MLDLTENHTFGYWSKQFLTYKRNKISVGYYKSLKSAIDHANDFFKDIYI